MHFSLNNLVASSTFGKFTLSNSGGRETPSGKAFLISLMEKSVVLIAANAVETEIKVLKIYFLYKSEIKVMT